MVAESVVISFILSVKFLSPNYKKTLTQVPPAALQLLSMIIIFILLTAVLNGDLKLFNQVVDKFKEKFLSEKTYTLIIRSVFCYIVSQVFICGNYKHLLLWKLSITT